MTALSVWLDVAISLGLSILVCLFHWPLLLGQGIALTSDAYLQYLPMEVALSQSLRAGTLPLWTPLLQTGFPLLAAGQPGVIYPIHLVLFFIFPVFVAHNISLILHGAIGVIGVYAWGRTLQLKPQGAFLAAIIFTLTSGLLDNIYPALPFAWLPWSFFSTQQLLRRSQSPRRYGCLLTLTIALQWLSGFPQAAFLGLVGVVGYGLILLGYERNWRQGRNWFILILCGCGLAAPQILPTYELAQQSVRATELSTSFLGYGSLFPLSVVSYLIPAWREPILQAALGETKTIGLISLMLVWLTILRSPSPAKRPLLLLAIGSIILSFGKYSPLFPVVTLLPGFDSVRVVSRFLVITQLSLAVLAGFGLDALTTKREFAMLGKRIIHLSLIVAVITIIGGLGLRFGGDLIFSIAEKTAQTMVNDPYHPQPWSFFEAKLTLIFQATLNATDITNLDVFGPLLVGGLCGLGLRNAGLISETKTKFLNSLLPHIVIGFVLIELLLIYGRGYQVVPKITLMHRADWMEAVQSGRMYRKISSTDLYHLHDNALPPYLANVNLYYDLADVGLYNPLGLRDYYDLLGPLSSVDLAFGLHPVSNQVLADWRNILDALSVTFIVSQTPLTLPKTNLLFADGTRYVYQNQQALPRAYLVSSYIEAKQGEPITEQLLSPTFDPVKQVILDQPVPEMVRRNNKYLYGVANIIQDHPHKMRIQTDASTATLLVLTDTYYPGWQAYIDDQPKTMYRANGVFRAVYVPPGLHEVTFRYVPTQMWLGVGLAALIINALFIWLLGPYDLRRLQL
ncbi:MAG: YfhO family protein [Chloroflexota bacterium]